MGSGRIDLTKVNKAGLLLDETQADYLAANPAEGGDVRTLNTASLADNECLASCSWTRTFTGTSTGAGTWGVSVESLDDGPVPRAPLGLARRDHRRDLSADRHGRRSPPALPPTRGSSAPWC